MPDAQTAYCNTAFVTKLGHQPQPLLVSGSLRQLPVHKLQQVGVGRRLHEAGLRGVLPFLQVLAQAVHNFDGNLASMIEASVDPGERAYTWRLKSKLKAQNCSTKAETKPL